MHSSKIVTTNQKGVHPNLTKVLRRFTLENYKRPVASFSRETMTQIKDWLNGDECILDLGCGIGESSYHLSQLHPSVKVVGIDKSESRLSRNNNFKQKSPNVQLFRGELLDLIPLLYRELKDQIIKVYILYPNPWPKSIHYKRRFHFNPVMPFLVAMNKELVLRSNWQLYLEEFSLASEFFSQGRSRSLSELKNNMNYLTPFERKYAESGQAIFELIIDS